MVIGLEQPGRVNVALGSWSLGPIASREGGQVIVRWRLPDSPSPRRPPTGMSDARNPTRYAVEALEGVLSAPGVKPAYRRYVGDV